MQGINAINVSYGAKINFKANPNQSIISQIDSLKQRIISEERTLHGGFLPPDILSAIEQEFAFYVDKAKVISLGDISNLQTSLKKINVDDLTSAYLAMGAIERSLSTVG